MTFPAELETWQRLLDEASGPLVEAAAAIDPARPAQIERLRRDYPAPLVIAAIELADARRRARNKLDAAERVVADVEGVEQATSSVVASHKARRFATALAPGTPILDLCCGIGGDAIALSKHFSVTAFDLDPCRAWMALRNAGCESRVADVESLDLDGATFHLDPARRHEGRRAWRYGDYHPGPAFIDRLLRTCPDGAVKLGPGIDPTELPLGPDRELEFVSDRGALVQAILWCGRLALHPGARTATRLPGSTSFSAAPAPGAPGGGVAPRTPPDSTAARDDLDRWLFVPDPALERAGLVAAHCRALPLREIHPGLGLLTSNEPIESDWLTPYAVLAQMPFREDRLRQWLRANGAGEVIIRTRGRGMDADALAARLRGKGEQAYEVFVLRLGRARRAVVARRAPADRPEPCPKHG